MPKELKDEYLTKNIVEYDFKKTRDVSQDKVTSLQVIFDAFSQKIASSLSAKLGTTVQTQVLSVTQSPYAGYVGTIQIPTLIGIIDMNPLKGMALIEITPNVIFNFIDRLLGGRGEIVSLSRGLTEIEFEVVEDIITGFTKDLKNSLANVIEIDPNVVRIESNPQFAQISSPKEKVIVGTIELKIGETRGNITLCLPFLIIEPIISKFTGEEKTPLRGGKTQTVSPEDLAKMRKAIEEVTLSLIVELGRTEVSVGDILDLKKGDVIRLKTKVEEPLTMYADEVPKFKCRPGIIGNRLATQIVKRIEG